MWHLCERASWADTHAPWGRSNTKRAFEIPPGHASAVIGEERHGPKTENLAYLSRNRCPETTTDALSRDHRTGSLEVREAPLNAGAPAEESAEGGSLS
jgi:hypothetical protein